jgi:hypothetical protein
MSALLSRQLVTSVVVIASCASFVQVAHADEPHAKTTDPAVEPPPQAESADSTKRRIDVGASVGIAFPFIGFSNDYTGALSFSGGVDFGFGGTLHANYFLSSWFAVGGNLGFFHFPGSEIDTIVGTIEAPSINLIPITLSASAFPRFDASERWLRPQFALDLGVYVIANEDDRVGAKARFGFAPVIGSGIIVTDRVSITMNTKFHVIIDSDSDFGFIGYLDVNLGVLIAL